MGVPVELIVEPEQGDAARELAAARAAIDALEARLSRFRPDSALSRLNAHGTVANEPELADVVELALAARDRTAGRFDPTVHDAMLAWGYDRTFADVRDDPSAPPGAVACGGGVHVDRVAGRVVLEPGTRLDLGGIAKGYVVDRAADVLGDAGPCVVNAGGDLAVRGQPGGEAWPVGIETPAGPFTVALPWGALATSGSDERRWRRGGGEAHHLIDPRTGAPSTSDLLRVTAAGATAVDAEVSAKALFLAGSEAAKAEADAAGIPSVLVTRRGETMLAGGLT